MERLPVRRLVERCLVGFTTLRLLVLKVSWRRQEEILLSV